jgi:multisubunit Na+/H+ antiporter MnhC subunit
MTTLAMITGGLLMAVGFWGILTRRNLIRIILSLAIAETGLHLVMIAVGYVRKGTAPILDSTAVAGQTVDPVPQALVLTAIVIGVAVNALLLALVIRLYRKKGTLNVEDFRELKW